MYRLIVLVAALSILGVVAVLSACAKEEQTQAQPATQSTTTQQAEPEQTQTPPTARTSQQQDARQPAAAQQQEAQAEPAQAQAEPNADQPQAQPEQQDSEPPPADTKAETKLVLGGDRPATLLLPQDADRDQPRPLIVLLHGYSSFSASEADAVLPVLPMGRSTGEFGLLFPERNRGPDPKSILERH